MAAPSEMPLPKSILVFNGIIEKIARCAEELADIRSPTNKHRDDIQAIRSKISVAQELMLQTSHMTERDRLQGEIQGHTAQLEELQKSYERGFGDAWAKYEHRADLAVKTLCEALDESVGTLLGPRGYKA